jgi:hypothetical protein
MHSYIAFQDGVIDNTTELVGDAVQIDLLGSEISLVPVDCDERVSVPLDSLTRVELEETPTVWDSRGKP